MQAFWQQLGQNIGVGMALIAVLTSCRGEKLSLPRSVPPVRYALAAHGLPTEGIWKSTPAVVDVNRDGLLDLASLPRLAHGARVWFHNGSGLWMEASAGLQMPSSCGGGVAFADVNRDGHLDLAIADHCEGVFIYLGDSHGHWQAVTESLNPALSLQEAPSVEDEHPMRGAEDLALGDVNEDGMLDLVVVASNEGGFSVYMGDGTGKSWQEITTADGLPSGGDPEDEDQERAGWANRVLLTDVNGDNHLDVVASYYTGPRVWRGDGTGRWQSASAGLSTPLAGGLFRGLAVGDINKDGHVDLVVANVTGGPEVYVQHADGTWHAVPSPAFSALQRGVTSVALGDLDGDSHLDLIIGGRRVSQDHSGLFAFRGDGKGNWTEVKETHLPVDGLPFIWGITLGDVNGDGALDVVVSTGIKSTAVHVEPNQPRRSLAGRVDERRLKPLTNTLRPEQPQLQVWINTERQVTSVP